jgi:hypothetical protein
LFDADFVDQVADEIIVLFDAQKRGLLIESKSREVAWCTQVCADEFAMVKALDYSWRKSDVSEV